MGGNACYALRKTWGKLKSRTGGLEWVGNFSHAQSLSKKIIIWKLSL